MSAGQARAARLLSRGKALKIAVSALAIWLVARQIDAGALASALAEARPAPLGGALAVYLLGQAVTAWRWRIIARSARFTAPLGRMLSWYFTGMFFNLFGPSTLGGDAVRSLYLAADGGRPVAAFQTVVIDRLSGLSMLVVLALAAFAAFGSFGVPSAMILATAALGAALALGWWCAPPLLRRFLPRGGGLSLETVNGEPDDLGVWRDGRLFVETSVVSLGFHVVQVGAAVLVGVAVGLPVPGTFYFVFHPLVTISSALPVSIAGLGVREAGYVWFLSTYGATSNEQATAFALLWLGVLTTSSLVGGLVFLASGARVPKAASASRAEVRA